MYSYPDKNDFNLITNIITKDWDDGGKEDLYIKECLDFIPKEKRNIILDAGCGQGNFFHKFVLHFQKIIAVDPDVLRIEKAQQTLKTIKNQQSSVNITSEFINSSIENIVKLNHKADFVLCGQVIQHVDTCAVPKILSKIHSLMQPWGHFVLLTTNWRQGEDEFSKTNCLTNDYDALTEKEFNECVNLNNHFLPCRLFEEELLRKILIDAGFEVIFIRKYHGYPKIKGDNFVFAKIAQ